MCTLPYSANQTSAPPTPPGPHKYNFNIFHQVHLYRNNHWNKDHSHLLFIITSTGSASHPQKSSPNSSFFHAPTLSWISRSPMYLKFHAPTLDLHVPSLHTFMHLPSPGPPGSHSVQDAPTLDLYVPTLHTCMHLPSPGPRGPQSTWRSMHLPWTSRSLLCTHSCPYPLLDLLVPTYPRFMSLPSPRPPCPLSTHIHAPTLSWTSRSPLYTHSYPYPLLDLQVPTVHEDSCTYPGPPGPQSTHIHAPTLSWASISPQIPAPTSCTYPLLDLQVPTLHKDGQLLLQGGVYLLDGICIILIFQAADHLAVQLEQVLHVDALDVARQGGQLGPKHGLQGLLRLLQVSVSQHSRCIQYGTDFRLKLLPFWSCRHKVSVSQHSRCIQYGAEFYTEVVTILKLLSQGVCFTAQQMYTVWGRVLYWSCYHSEVVVSRCLFHSTADVYSMGQILGWSCYHFEVVVSRCLCYSTADKEHGTEFQAEVVAILKLLSLKVTIITAWTCCDQQQSHWYTKFLF